MDRGAQVLAAELQPLRRAARPRQGARPRAEALKDVAARLLPYWYDAIVPDLRTGVCVLVVSHGNTLRALVKHLDRIPDDQIAGLTIPTGIPLAYSLGQNMHPLAAGGRYLDSTGEHHGRL